MKDKNLNVKTYCKIYFKTSMDLWIFLLLSLSQAIIANMGMGRTYISKNK